MNNSFIKKIDHNGSINIAERVGVALQIKSIIEERVSHITNMLNEANNTTSDSKITELLKYTSPLYRCEINKDINYCRERFKAEYIPFLNTHLECYSNMLRSIQLFLKDDADATNDLLDFIADLSAALCLHKHLTKKFTNQQLEINDYKKKLLKRQSKQSKNTIIFSSSQSNSSQKTLSSALTSSQDNEYPLYVCQDEYEILTDIDNLLLLNEKTPDSKICTQMEKDFRLYSDWEIKQTEYGEAVVHNFNGKYQKAVMAECEGLVNWLDSVVVCQKKVTSLTLPPEIKESYLDTYETNTVSCEEMNKQLADLKKKKPSDFTRKRNETAQTYREAYEYVNYFTKFGKTKLQTHIESYKKHNDQHLNNLIQLHKIATDKNKLLKSYFSKKNNDLNKPANNQSLSSSQNNRISTSIDKSTNTHKINDNEVTKAINTQKELIDNLAKENQELKNSISDNDEKTIPMLNELNNSEEKLKTVTEKLEEEIKKDIDALNKELETIRQEQKNAIERKQKQKLAEKALLQQIKKDEDINIFFSEEIIIQNDAELKHLFNPSVTRIKYNKACALIKSLGGTIDENTENSHMIVSFGNTNGVTAVSASSNEAYKTEPPMRLVRKHGTDSGEVFGINLKCLRSLIKRRLPDNWENINRNDNAKSSNFSMSS